MAITIAGKDSGALSGQSGAVVSASMTIATGNLAIVFTATRDVGGLPSKGVPSGSGISTVVELGTELSVEFRTTAYSAQGNGVADNIDMTETASSDESFCYSILEVAGVNLGAGAVTGGIQQAVKTATALNTAGGTMTLSALSALQPGSATLVGLSIQDGTTATIDPSAGWTEVHDLYDAVNDTHLESSYLIAGATSPVLHTNPTLGASSIAFAAFAIELLAASAGAARQNRPSIVPLLRAATR